jgi:hypothetical protein
MGATGHAALSVTASSSCTTCHASTYFGVTVKPSGHVATSAGQNCTACHARSFVSFAGANYVHPATAAGQCNTCHRTGGSGLAPVSNHVPVGSAQCDQCHKSTVTGGFASFTMGTTGHAALSVSTGSDCTRCHIGSYFGVTVKPSTHIATTPANQNCSACHNGFTTFAGASFNHSAVSTGTCNSCHLTGTGGAMVKPANHVPTASVSCDTCHKSTAVGAFATYTVGNAGHAALGVILSSSNCMTCHTGAYLGMKTFKPHPGKHGATTSTANQCGTCHKSFTRDPGD